MHSKTTPPSPHQPAFTRMQPAPDLDSPRQYLAAKRCSAADCPSRPVKRRQEAISGRVNLTTAEQSELPAHDPVVLFEQLAPVPISQLGCPFRRVDNVRE